MAASLIFYGSWNPIYVPGFLLLIVVNYALGLWAAGPHRRLAIWVAVLFDLGVLGIFKYLDWLVGTSSSFITLFTGQPFEPGLLGLVLPLAISFVMFTMLAYVIDIYRGAAPERNLLRFTMFISFFPHLIAGPIMRGWEFLPQVRHPRPFAREHVTTAMPLLVGGLLKKTAGDQLAPYVQTIFAAPERFSSAGLWLGAVAFGFQIYLDFSGYTDLALGSASLLGFKLPRNFDWPYRSLNIQEFWRRWHMTLSRWLRDYLYIPLGGSRHGSTRTYFALMTTMLLGGLWHGAGLTFVIWGGWHGIGLAAHRFWRQGQLQRPRFAIPAVVAWAMTIAFVMLGWVFFRAVDLTDALTYLRGMLIPQGGRLGMPLPLAALLILGLVAQWPGWADRFRALAPAYSPQRWLAYGTAVLVAVLILPPITPSFIYFQF